MDEGARRLVRDGELTGLPVRVAAILRRHGLTTRAAVGAWYGRERQAARPLRGIGPGSVEAIVAWLGADAEEERDDDAG